MKSPCRRNRAQREWMQRARRNEGVANWISPRRGETFEARTKSAPAGKAKVKRDSARHPADFIITICARDGFIIATLQNGMITWGCLLWRLFRGVYNLNQISKSQHNRFEVPRETAPLASSLPGFRSRFRFIWQPHFRPIRSRRLPR